MKFLGRIFQRIKGHRYETQVVIDPKELAPQPSGRRIVLFGSRCVVLQTRDRKL